MKRLVISCVLGLTCLTQAQQAAPPNNLPVSPPAPTVASDTPKAAPKAAEIRKSNQRALSKLRENLKPVPTGDAWLDSILDEWSGFAFDSVDEVLRHFGFEKDGELEKQ